MGATKLDQYSSEIKSTAEINKVLSHPARLTIIQSLKENPGLRPLDLMKIVELSHAATSDHLNRLKLIGVIEYRYEFHFYQVFLVPEKLKKAIDFLQRMEN